MPMYTFYLRRPDSGPTGLDACEFDHDGETFARAGQLLQAHPSCDHVEVWEGERPVVSRHRRQPMIRPVGGSVWRDLDA